MNKKQIMEFIVEQRTKVIREIEQSMTLEINKYKSAVLSEYSEELSALQEVTTTITAGYSSFISSLLTNDKITSVGSGYRDIDYCVSHLNADTFTKDYIKEINFEETEELSAIKNRFNKEIAKVKSEYHSVSVYCKSLASAKQVSEYLTTLGFDLPEEAIDVKPIVDKSSLFLNGYSGMTLDSGNKVLEIEGGGC